MITIIRSAAISPGKTGDALAFAKTIAKHIEEKYGTKLELIMPIGGNPNRIAWLGRYETLAQWETLTTKALTDPEYTALVANNAPNFIPGSVHDEIWRSI
jgi:hypothetical protein